MLARILRSTIVLAAVIAAYEAYAQFAVPRMEPPLVVRKQTIATDGEIDTANNAPTKYQRLLLNYFPADHWTQVRQPKVFANGTEQAMLVLDEYKRTPAGTDKEDVTQLDIKQFAMVMFPTPPHGEIIAPRDAIILESQQGAKLLIENFHPEQGKLGQVLRGEFPGPIRIRSDMHEAGPDDDLLVETSDLQMNTKLLYTTAPVRFRLGQNVGGGRELEIRFLPDEHAKSKDVGLKFAGFDSLEIRRDVRMRMQLNTASLVPGNEKDAKPGPAAQANAATSKAPAAPATPPVPKPPVDVTCNGPFNFDFVKYKASVDRDVVVRQLNLEGPADQLNCNELDIYFTPKELPPSAKPESNAGDPSKLQQRNLGRLEASTVIASGHPAIAISPARKVEARGERIHIALREQRMRIEGGNDTRLTQGPNVLQAPLIDYQQPEKDSGTKIGIFRATGPGSLHYVSDEKRPDQIFQAAWQTSVQLGRDQGQPTIVMEGRPEVAFGAAGSLIADQIRLYLRELAGDADVGMKVGGGAAPGGGGNVGDKKDQAKVAPDRMIAVGHVEISSPQMAGRTQQLTANFQLQPAGPPAAAVAATAGAVGAGAPAAAGGAKTGLGGGKQQAPGKPDAPQQSYQVVADQMRLELFLKGQTAVPATLACDGNIIVRGVPQAGDTQQPIEIRGQQVFVDKLDTKTPHVILRGAAIGNGATVKPIATGAGPPLAQVTGRGITLLTSTIEMDGRDNNTWSDGPGEATVQMARDLQGNALTAPAPVNIRWRNGLRFDGQTITFNEDVVVASADSSLHCDRLTARLAAPLKIGQRVEQSATSFSQIDCEGQVLIENLSRDAGGVTAHDRMQLGHLTINQQTGDIRGEGPGIIRSTRFGAGLGALGSTPGAKPPAAGVAPAGGSKLNFLRVDFHTGLDGNMYTRMLTFHDRVRTVYGPVDAWEQELDLTRPETLPMDSMTLSCDELRLNEDPAAPKAAPKAPGAGPKGMDAIQVNAQRNVKIDGQSAVQGQFSVQADRASYDKLKDLFILEGDTRTPARLWRRAPSGADSPPLEARKIYYSRTTNQVKVEGIQSFEFTPSDLEKTQRPKPGAPGVR